jgi:hypothetical protein
MKILIDGEKWSVKFQNEVIYEGHSVAGLCWFDKKKMLIALVYSPEVSDKELIFRISETFYHEYLHAVFYVNAFRDQSFWTPDFEHTVIAPIARSLAKNFPLRVKLK